MENMAKAASLGATPIAFEERLDKDHVRQHSGGSIGEFTIPMPGGIREARPQAAAKPEVPAAPEIDAEEYRQYLIARAYAISGRGFEEVQDVATLQNINILNGFDMPFEQFHEIKQRAREIANGTQASEG